MSSSIFESQSDHFDMYRDTDHTEFIISDDSPIEVIRRITSSSLNEASLIAALASILVLKL